MNRIRLKGGMAACLVAVAGGIGLASGPAGAAVQPYRLIENFSGLPEGHAERRGTLVASVVTNGQQKVGLGALRLDYRLDTPQGRATYGFDPPVPVAGPGMVRVWIRGDGSSNAIRFAFSHGRRVVSPNGEVRLEDVREESPAPVALAFTGWREVDLDLRNLPAERALGWRSVSIEGTARDTAPAEGSVLLDDMRLFGKTASPSPATMKTCVMGTRRFDDARTLAVSVDLRNFGTQPLSAKVRLSLTDRDDTAAADVDRTLRVDGGDAQEVLIPLAPDDPARFVPPYRLRGDVLCAELPDDAERFELPLPVANGYVLFEPFADVRAHWVARPAMDGRFTEHELYRYTAASQTNLVVSRVAIEAGGEAGPPPGTAMRIAYTGEGGVFNMRPPSERYLPGDAFRMGVWIRGDGSGAVVSVLVHDYSDMAGYFSGDWQRVRDPIELARLDFQGWRYVEVKLPGGGVGTHLPRGSTRDTDFPLELAGFLVRPDARGGGGPAGCVDIGPVSVMTQQRVAANLAVALGYDDPDHFWAPDRKAWVVVQNGRLDKATRMSLAWSLADRDGAILGQGRATADLAAREARTLPIDLSICAEAARQALAPFTLKASLTTADDGAVTLERALVLAKPDSRGLHAGFEEERAYEPMRATGVDSERREGVPTSTTQAHSGQRSLPLAWSRDKGGDAAVSVDPALPGIPVRVSLWLYGDGSRVLFHPVIGDRNGANRGVSGGQWDLFPARLADGSGREAVVVDWAGWRRLEFLLPVIPANWADDAHVLPFVPSYPLGLHLVAEGAGATTGQGALYVDDVSVETHLPPAERVGMRLGTLAERNLLASGAALDVDVWNVDLAVARTVSLSGGIVDWRGRRVAGGDQVLTLNPGEQRRVTVARACPPGAYAFRAALSEGTTVVSRVTADAIVADAAALLGVAWPEALAESWKLRTAVGSAFEVVNEDWDWIEPHPGNLQVMTAKQRIAAVAATRGDPYLLLGYSAYWASGEGYEGLRNGVFARRARDVGHGVNVFMPPERIDDWDNYVRGVMRGVGRNVSGWVLWDNPDGSGPLAVKPDKFAAMVAACDRWRRAYAADKPLLLGGLQRDTAMPYLQALNRADSNTLGRISGVHVRLDLGRLPPEDAQVTRYVEELRAFLGEPGGRRPTILLTDVDWAVERAEDGLNAFDQAAYVARAELLLAPCGVHPVPLVANADLERYGLGLVYRESRTCPPFQAPVPSLRLKPAWLALAKLRTRLAGLEVTGSVPVMDRRAGLTWGMLFRQADGTPVLAAWRNDAAGGVSFEGTGLSVAAAEDLFGTEVVAANGAYPIGRVPVWFTLKASGEPPLEALSRLRVREAAGAASWAQLPVALVLPAAGGRWGYGQTGGQAARLTGRMLDGTLVERDGVVFGSGGTEHFDVPVPSGAGLVLRKAFKTGPVGEVAEMAVNGAPAVAWHVGAGDEALEKGLAEAVWVVDAAAVKGAGRVRVDVRYPRGGNTVQWSALEYRGGAFPLEAVGAVHVQQNAARPRPGRNVVGGPLRIGETAYADGVGVFAQSLMEVALNRQFGQFRATVGVDAAAEGRGSVVFEVQGDGRKLWASPVMSGLDAARTFDVSVQGVDRLRLIVTDAGDGNRFDAADWCDAVLALPASP